MKTKILLMVVLMSLSVVLMAQKTQEGPGKSLRGAQREMSMHQERGPAVGLNLTDAQKETFKQSMMALQKELKSLRNELGEAMAHQRTLVSVDKPDLSAVNKNIEKIGVIKTEMAKTEVKHHLEMRAQLSEEQKMKFDLFKQKMKHNNGPVGKRHKMQM